MKPSKLPIVFRNQFIVYHLPFVNCFINLAPPPPNPKTNLHWHIYFRGELGRDIWKILSFVTVTLNTPVYRILSKCM